MLLGALHHLLDLHVLPQDSLRPGALPPGWSWLACGVPLLRSSSSGGVASCWLGGGVGTAVGSRAVQGYRPLLNRGNCDWRCELRTWLTTLSLLRPCEPHGKQLSELGLPMSEAPLWAARITSACSQVERCRATTPFLPQRALPMRKDTVDPLLLWLTERVSSLPDSGSSALPATGEAGCDGCSEVVCRGTVAAALTAAVLRLIKDGPSSSAAVPLLLDALLTTDPEGEVLDTCTRMHESLHMSIIHVPIWTTSCVGT